MFGDPLSWTVSDPDHSIGEQRFLTIGVSSQGKTLVVSHTDRGIKTRIINARPATPSTKRSENSSGWLDTRFNWRTETTSITEIRREAAGDRTVPLKVGGRADTHVFTFHALSRSGSA